MNKLNRRLVLCRLGFWSVTGLALIVAIVVRIRCLLANLIIAELLVGAVTVGSASGLFALAQNRLFVFFRLEDLGFESGVSMGTVAERLVIGTTTDAKGVFFALFETDFLGLTRPE